MANNAILILYSGNEMPDILVEKMVGMIVQHGVAVPENITVVVKDADAIAKALIRENCEHISFVENRISEDEAIKNAAVYIGTTFESSIRNTAMFAIELSCAVNKASIANKESNLLKAIEILSTKSGVLPKAIARKYHFTSEILNVIKKVYNTYVQ